jgi:hypothetical protein
MPLTTVTFAGKRAFLVMVSFRGVSSLEQRLKDD